jgi:CubicO group peptidase (beta-lactamase class C family)
MFAGRVHLRTVLAGSIFASMSALPALASQPLHRPAPGESDAATSLAAVDGKHHAEAARLPARLARVVDLYAREHAFSGTIMLSHRGQLVFSRSLGMADEGWGIPNAPDTRYRIASMTKAFTALAVLKLHQARRLKLDSPIRDLVPGQDPRITIRHLLLHRSGLARDPADLSDKGMESRFTLAEIAGIAARSTLAFEPGTDYAYSNIGYSLLAAAIEAATGQAYEQSLRTLVLDPMSLGETFNEPSARPLPHLARGYFMLPDGLADASVEDKSHVLGAGSLTSTAGDMIRFLDALESDPGISVETRGLYLTEAAKNRSHGLVTWEYKVADSSGLEPRRGRVVMHGGSAPGYESAFGRFLDHDVSIVILGNRSPFPAASLFNALGNAALGFETPPEVHSNLPWFRQAIALGADASLAQHRASTEGAATPSEGETNRMGYNLLGVGRFADAITLFRLNALLHPESANAHDSLGEAYLTDGQNAQALASYRRVLELAPGHPAATRAIRLIGSGPDHE